MDHFIWNDSVERVKLLLDTYRKCCGSSHNGSALIYRTFKGCALLLFEKKKFLSRKIFVVTVIYSNCYCLDQTYNQIFIHYVESSLKWFLYFKFHIIDIFIFYILFSLFQRCSNIKFCHRLFESIIINFVYSLC